MRNVRVVSMADIVASTIAAPCLDEDAAVPLHRERRRTERRAAQGPDGPIICPLRLRPPTIDRFWRALRNDSRVMRSAEASASLNGIYDAVGRRREIETMSAFERAAREVYGAAPGYPGL